MKSSTSAYILVILSGFFLFSCTSKKMIQEDFHTETYKSRMNYFSEHPLLPEQIVFFGNSITQAGEWSTYFPTANVANRGISGDNTEGMLARLSEIEKTQPSKFFIMAGINDISLSRPNRVIVKNYRQIIRSLRNASPHTQIFMQSVLPINNDFGRYKRLTGKERQIVELNTQLRILAQSEGVTFINLYPFFINSEGKLKKEFTGDGLHLSAEAYALWVQIIQPYF